MITFNHVRFPRLIVIDTLGFLSYFSGAGVDILPHVSINIVETNKHFGKRWKGIRKIKHFPHPIHHFQLIKRAWTQISSFCSKLTPSSEG